MASNGIKDRVAIVGMGCTPFGEHWDKGAGRPARRRRRATPTARRASIPTQVDAYWLGTMGSGISGLMLSEALKIPYKPVTRLENMCATGSEAMRNAAYAVAQRRLRPGDGDRRREAEGLGLLGARRQPARRTTARGPSMTAPAMFSLLAPAYAKKYGVDEGELKEVLARIAWKNHKNGAKNPKAQFRKEVPMETIMHSRRAVAGMLGIFDCSGVSRRLGRRDPVPRRGRAQVHEAPDLHQGARRSPPARPRATSARTTTSPPSRRWWRARRTPTSRPASRNPRERDQHGRGARLLHADRARADGGHGLLAARPGLEGRARRAASTATARSR